MTNKTVYQLSARQILLLAFSTALIAVGATALVYSLTYFWNGNLPDQEPPSPGTAAVPEGISEPAQVTDGPKQHRSL